MTFDLQGSGRKEIIKPELLSAIDTVQLLKDRIKSNETITGETIGGFSCLWGCKIFDAEINEASTHRPWCAWNYYVRCPSCGYEGNLAKYSINEDGFLSAGKCECVQLS